MNLLLLLTLIHFMLILSIHLWLGGSVSSRIAFAVLMSVVPALGVLMVKPVAMRTAGRIALSYFAVSVLVHIMQTILRQ